MNKEKNEYLTPCVDALELIVEAKILDGSPMENVTPGGEHDWNNG